MDLVVPLSQYSHRRDDLELRFMLRSAVANCRDLWRVFIVGHKPDWLRESDGLVHIPCQDPHGVSKDANIIHKLLLACQTLASDFIVNSDDQIFCTPVEVRDLWAVWLDTAVQLRQAEECRNYSFWHDRLLRSLDECRRLGWPDWVCECHIPYPVDHEWYPRLMAQVDWNAGNGLWTHIYLNGYVGQAWPRRLNAPVEPPGSLMVRFKRGVSYPEAKQALETHRFVNFNDAGFTDGMKQALAEKFPEPSPWEDKFG